MRCIYTARKQLQWQLPEWTPGYGHGTQDAVDGSALILPGVAVHAPGSGVDRRVRLSPITALGFAACPSLRLVNPPFLIMFFLGLRLLVEGLIRGAVKGWKR
jgi:hypothetical protein